MGRDQALNEYTIFYDYYKQHHYENHCDGRELPSHQQILTLTGCDRLTISRNLLKELQEKFCQWYVN
ncbi:transaldolase family protein [Shigella flexneri]